MLLEVPFFAHIVARLVLFGIERQFTRHQKARCGSLRVVGIAFGMSVLVGEPSPCTARRARKGEGCMDPPYS